MGLAPPHERLERLAGVLEPHEPPQRLDVALQLRRQGLPQHQQRRVPGRRHHRRPARRPRRHHPRPHEGRLARPRGPDHREEPPGPDALPERLDLALPPEEAVRVRLRERAQAGVRARRPAVVSRERRRSGPVQRPPRAPRPGRAPSGSDPRAPSPGTAARPAPPGPAAAPRPSAPAAGPRAGSPRSCPPPSPPRTPAGPTAPRRESPPARRGPTARPPPPLAPAPARGTPGVPITTPATVCVRSGPASAPSPRVSFARPKSRIFTKPSDVRNRFSGLRSRCRIPRACAACSPRHACTAVSTAERSGSGPVRSRCLRVSPSSSSKTT